MCEYRAAREEEFEQIRLLWKEGFGDGDKLIDEYRRLLYRPENTEVAVCGDQVVAMVMVVPAVLHKSAGGTMPAGYAYGLTTRSDWRKRGIGIKTYQSMIRRKISEGMLCVAGSQDDEDMLGFYLRHSWEKAFYVRELTAEAAALPEAPAADWAAPEEYIALRETALRGTDHYVFDLPYVQMQEYVSRDGGGGLLKFPGSGACCAVAAYEDDETVLLSELLAPDDRLLACAAGVLRRMPARRIRLRLPAWSGAAVGAELVPYAVMLPEGEGYSYIMEHPDAYLGLDLC